MNDIMVSVIMSTYNTQEEYLREAIESILNQTLKKFEFIIVVDGISEDIQTINSYKDERIIIVKHTENKGLPYSLNEAIKIARGKYIARMDSDDISYKNRLLEQVTFLENNKDVDICSMFSKKIGDENCKDVLPYTKSEYINIHMLFLNPLVHPLVMIRKKFLFENNLFYNEKFTYSQDYELWNRCRKIGKIEIIPKIGLKYRIHKKQISTDKKNVQMQFYREIVKMNINEFIENANTVTLNTIESLFKDIGYIDFNQLIKFSELVQKIVENNKNYNINILKKVLYVQLFNRALKSKLILNNFIEIIKNKTIRKQIFAVSNIELNLKKFIIK